VDNFHQAHNTTHDNKMSSEIPYRMKFHFQLYYWKGKVIMKKGRKFTEQCLEIFFFFSFLFSIFSVCRRHMTIRLLYYIVATTTDICGVLSAFFSLSFQFNFYFVIFNSVGLLCFDFMFLKMYVNFANLMELYGHDWLWVCIMNSGGNKSASDAFSFVIFTVLQKYERSCRYFFFKNLNFPALFLIFCLFTNKLLYPKIVNLTNFAIFELFSAICWLNVIRNLMILWSCPRILSVQFKSSLNKDNCLRSKKKVRFVVAKWY